MARHDDDGDGLAQHCRLQLAPIVSGGGGGCVRGGGLGEQLASQQLGCHCQLTMDY